MALDVLLAIIPIIWLIASMTFLKMSGVKACSIGLAITAAESLIAYDMTPLEVFGASAEGVASAIWPICIIIIVAMFTYNMSLHTGAMDVIKKMLASVSNDKRIVALILAWGFSNFMEGVAGFGTAVAIPAAMMVGLGFEPISAAIICIVGNGASAAFGAIGTPTFSAASTAGLDGVLLAEPTAFLLLGLNIVSPFIIVCLVGGSVKALKGIIPMAALSAVISFYVPFYACAKFLGPELCIVAGALCCLICLIMIGRVGSGSDKQIPKEYLLVSEGEEISEANMGPLKAWLPYILMLALLLGTSKLIPTINTYLGQFKSSIVFYPGSDAASISFSWVNTPGVLMLVATIIGSAVQGASLRDMLSVFGKTLKGYWKAVTTVMCIVAIAKLMGYSGMIVAIANGLVALTGAFYPAIAPLIGGIGCFVTGSVTSAGIMFAKLQTEVALQLGIDPYWLVAANSAGATAGKMISPQSIAIAVAAVSASGKDSIIMRKAIPWCALYTVIVCAMCFFGA